jgi:hypothetical protein
MLECNPAGKFQVERTTKRGLRAKQQNDLEGTNFTHRKFAGGGNDRTDSESQVGTQ